MQDGEIDVWPTSGWRELFRFGDAKILATMTMIGGCHCRRRIGTRALLLLLLQPLNNTVLTFVMPARQLHHRRVQPEPNFSTLSSRGSQQAKLGAKLANDESAAEAATGGTASIPNLSVSLVKSIVGSGVLALPAGVATLGDSPSVKVIVPAIILILIIGAINAYFFSLIGRVCDKTGATGYREAWEWSMGPDTSQYVAVAVASKTFLTCLAFSIIIADSFQSLAVAGGLEDATRTQALGVVTIFGLLPLCLLRDLSSLAPFSFLGLIGMGFTTCVMVLRLFDGSYDLGSDSLLLKQVSTELQPSFGFNGPSLSGIVLCATLATAFVAHYNAPRFHAELQDNTVERFNIVVGLAFFISAVVFSIVAVVGFLTFGSASSGLILNNYSPYDPLVTASRAAVALSIVFTYPLVFLGFRDGVLDVMKVQERGDNLVTIVSVALLAAVTLAAANVTDLAIVLSVGGGTFSTAVASVFPALMFRATVKDSTESSDELDATLALVLMWICIGLGLAGVSIAIQNAI